MNIEIIPLNESHVLKARGLITGYINSSSNGVDETDFSIGQLEACEQTLNRLMHNNNIAQCFLAKHEQELVGFIVLSWGFSMSKGYPVLRIDPLYSSPKYRNKGVGRALMQYAIDLAIEKKASRLQLETDDDNKQLATCIKTLDLSR
ncbi:GNAT family N-acetyltransferase [Paenibacillus foliorum]|uniref:GNAT family N-acetyltransferase n=1 Tax=Paenibacillus foliorum TaxID=2654974 RepID=UPI001FE27D72|nr:GNAT family N-acetyltransferase [Paenibacillus foliorum]